MLIGYVSDEYHVAIADVCVEFTSGDQCVATRSLGSGAIYADLEPGGWQVTLTREGFTGKHVPVRIDPDARPFQFRLLSDRMYGFMWPKWVRSGQTSEYCVNSTEEFRLDLWRYGWEKEFIRSYGWCSEHGPRAMTQMLPDDVVIHEPGGPDFVQTGVGWNRVGYTLEFQKHGITAPQRSGLYFLHATTRDGTCCTFPWIISPAEPQSRIAVLASTMTWNAYNSFGGRSNYFNQDGLRPRPIVNSRQELERYTRPGQWPFEHFAAPLSFERPEPVSEIDPDAVITDTIPGRMGSCFAPGEWRLLGWMEREGFEHDLYSETELHFDRVPLDEYDVLVLNNHPEYWSKEMYFRVKKWVYERGGKLAYLGGCGLLAEAVFLDEHTMQCRQEERHDLRGESEAHLLGVAYTHSGFQSGAPYQVLNDSHWVFEGTGLKNGDLFGLQSLHERCPGGASAHELDKLSPDSPAGIVHLAKGQNPEGTGADATYFETPSGGAVFAAGSMCWTLSLPIDEGISAVTRNLLTRFLS